jgi:hypothetical protein
VKIKSENILLPLLFVGVFAKTFSSIFKKNDFACQKEYYLPIYVDHTNKAINFD